MDTHTDQLALLRLTAEIARAGREPERWPALFDAIGQYLQCPDVFGVGFAPDGDVRAVIQRAGECAEKCQCTCGGSDPVSTGKRQVCAGIVEHLMLALDLDRKTVGDTLDALGYPLFIVDSDARLIHANAPGRRLLENNPWLSEADGQLKLHYGGQTMPLNAVRTITGERQRLSIPLTDRNEAVGELWLKRLRREGDATDRFLVSFVTHRNESQPTDEGLSARQNELANHLLAGDTLAIAATRMGITRHTAKYHLDLLFKLSGTRRQADLVAWLTRGRLR